VSPHDPTRSPDALAARFLGRSAGAGGPFALLGVGHGTRDAAALRAAVARRLAQIDRHPLRLTPEADELRLAVHAAMAQLTDPALHTVLVRYWPEGEQEHAPAAWRSPLTAVSDQMARQARLIVGASGGWNTRAKKRLAHLARLHRVNAGDLIRALRPPATGPARVGRPGPVRTMAFSEIAPPGSSGRVWLLIHASLVVLLVGMTSVAVTELVRPAPAAAPPGPSTPESPSAAAPTAPAPRASIMHHAALEQELGNTLRAAADDPEQGVARAGRALQTFFVRWPDMPSDARDRIVALAARIIATLPEAWLPAVEAGVGAGVASTDITTHAGATAVAARLGADPLLTGGVRGRYMTLAPGIDPGAGFDSAAVATLRSAVSGESPSSPSQWAAWSAALESCASVPVSERTRVRLDALEHQLRRPGRAGDSWRAIATSLASGLSWRSGAPARAWLLTQLADESVPTTRLAELTAVLATEVSVPGVDAAMVLAPQAGASERAQLAAAYRAAWAAGGGDETVRSEAQAALAAATERAERSTPNASDRVGVLVALARANAAAAALHAGEDALAAEILAMPEFTPPASPPPGRAIGALTDDWGLTLLNAQSPDLASAMLIRAMQDRIPFSPLAAEALVATAQSGENRALRDQARALAVASAWDVQVLLAIERAAARRPTAVLGDIVTTVTGVVLPAPRDEDWRDRVRSALLPRIAELVAESSPTDLVYAELELAELAARRAGLDTGAAHPRSLLVETERLLHANTLPGSDPLSPDAIRARQTARASTAGARAQLVAVGHRALVDSIAATAVARGARPRSTIDRRLATLAADWSNARTVIDQLLASHLAESELWRSLLEGAI
jgi:hypothetical protein